LYLFHTNYTNIDKITKEFPNHYVKGILFDLGVSYHQISTPARGFTYNSNGPLDMRFNQSLPSKCAKEIIQHSPLSELKRIFSEYGEERNAYKIATRIFAKRNNIKSTAELANAVREMIPPYRQNKTLARIFQSLRIVVNRELENIKIGLEKAIEALAMGARIAVISYHSLEDRIVKQTFRHYAETKSLKILTKKPLRPEPVEVANNISARSARLRAAEKI
jgi:16S rRNA (cytosine1402-N4)-methyltransferase